MRALFKGYRSFCGEDVWWAWSLAAFIAVIIAINALRFWDLGRVPAGFQVDEISSAVTLKCLATEGLTPRLEKPGLFIGLNYGSPKPPTYVYPGAAWVRVFGGSIASVRSFSAVWALVMVLGMFFLSRALWGNRCGVITALLATASPWLWMFSRLSYESIVGPAFLVWGLFFFLRRRTVKDDVLSGVLLSLAMYSYPPLRAQVFLLIVPLFLYRWTQGAWRWNAAGAFLLAWLIASLPLGLGVVRGELLGRFQQISIASPEYLASVGKTNSFSDLCGIFIQNFLSHFSPRFLFVSGDPSLINSTQRAGILGWAEVCGVLALGFRAFLSAKTVLKGPGAFGKVGPFLLFCAAGTFAGVVPSALTNYELPHALRSIGAWPFYILTAGLGAFLLAEKWKPALPGLLAITVVFSAIFFRDYFGDYVQRSRWMFSPVGYDVARSARTEEDWRRFMLLHVNQDYHFQYYTMQYAGDTCSASRTKWRKLRAMLGLAQE